MKKLTGTIVADKMNKTKVVMITYSRRHPIYHKAYQKNSKILAHDEKDEYKTNDTVEIVSTRPLSKYKSWKITRKIK